MSLARLIELGLAAPTPQHIASLALAEHQAARRAAAMGDEERRVAHERETDALVKMMHREGAK